MSTDIKHSMMERAIDIACARNSYNFKELYRVAKLEAKEENFELADELYKEAKKIEEEWDWAHDRAQDEQLIDEMV